MGNRGMGQAKRENTGSGTLRAPTGNESTVRVHRTHDGPESGTECVVVYRDYDNIILQENNGLTERRPKRYTINLTEEAGPRDDQLLEDSLDVRNTWEVVGEVDGKSYWRRRQDLSESRAYQKIVEDDIHDRIRLEQEVPCALLSYSPGLRLWLDETTGEELQQQDVPVGNVSSPHELAATGEMDLLIVQVHLAGDEVKALIEVRGHGEIRTPRARGKTRNSHDKDSTTILPHPSRRHGSWGRRMGNQENGEYQDDHARRACSVHIVRCRCIEIDCILSTTQRRAS
ncbi:hypothetical protein DL95DRAFT_417109 [Leptodontidium sp. 2 PMI_412]|nr:hypothetical protein BKA61DRAFT_582623 [Leptodontidium sp. MPI-SDFR-AT-0119]KAH9205799.1 hypothetical protein DL95DRAFT_417109 [Leptodontidium sp. 2 PMI_412]